MAYKTKQREYILAFLQNSAGRHITVAELVRHLQDNETPVGTATVYRTLEQLVEEGIVRKYVLDGKSSACYQFLSGEPHACTEHFHLKCTQCGQLFHVSCDYLNQLGEHLLEHHGFVIDHTKTVLYGLCAPTALQRNKRKRCSACRRIYSVYRKYLEKQAIKVISLSAYADIPAQGTPYGRLLSGT
ncbi:MAG: Fur family transcriptional regulator [Ruminococcus callidus]